MKASKKSLIQLNLYTLVALAIGLSILAIVVWPIINSDQGPQVVIYKSPTCGCCKEWASYLEDNGFNVTQIDTNNMGSVKLNQGIPQQLASCHTALINGYVVEGHVPVEAIRRMLKEKPAIKGIAVPGMPAGSPGMEQGGRKNPYNVMAIQRDGTAKIFESYKY
jgi:hypothetical protein